MKAEKTSSKNVLYSLARDLIIKLELMGTNEQEEIDKGKDKKYSDSKNNSEDEPPKKTSKFAILQE